jgi:transketolase
MDSAHIDLLARSLSADSISATTAAGSGHPTSSMSASHLLATLLANHFRFDVDRPDHPANDRLVLSKGHAAPLLYAALAAAGIIGRESLNGLRTVGGVLEGHPVPGLPLIDVATGSLGQGLANGLGMAMGMRKLRSPGRVWVIVGDSEMAEGSVWEAMALASHHGVANLVAILDMNRLGQTGPTMYGWDPDVYAERAASFGWMTVVVDGHDPDDIDRALAAAGSASSPTMIIARTVKGHGVSFLADQPGKHGEALSEDERDAALDELDLVSPIGVAFDEPPAFDPGPAVIGVPQRPVYDEAVATRDAFGDALAAEASADPTVVVVDAEVGNSTRTDKVSDRSPDSFVQMFIAEQAMVGVAVGLDAVGFRPVVASFAAFLSRAHDFFRMAAIGRANMIVAGSHAGVSIGEDGPSQMGIDDIAMMRAIPGTTVLYPADGNATVALLATALGRSGMTYLRTTRGATPHLYGPDAEFPVGGSHVLRSSVGDVATVVAAGVTVFEALDAAEALAGDGLPVQVIDVYSVEPIDRHTLRQAMLETGRMIVVEDHSVAGGLGDAVAEAVGDLPSGSIDRLAVRSFPGSADPATQRRLAGIDADAICAKVREVVERRI